MNKTLMFTGVIWAAVAMLPLLSKGILYEQMFWSGAIVFTLGLNWED